MSLIMNPEKALEIVNEYLKEVDELLKKNYQQGSERKSELDSKIQGFVKAAFDDDREYSTSPYTISRTYRSDLQKRYISTLKRIKNYLISFKEEIEISKLSEKHEKTDTLNTLKLIFSNFNSVTRQLRTRYSNRETLDVSDEYDVQDLLHAILEIFFSDIRPEEYTPSYAGNHRRMDFLLKNEKTVIEVKMTRPNLKNKEASEQLNDDIATYKTHMDCDVLVCFIYDPDGWINNPIGFERDISSQSSEELQVKAFIFPK